MLTPDPSEPYGVVPINRSGYRPTIDQIVPKTATDHLLPEYQRPQAVGDREAIEELGREMDRKSTREAMYPIYYEEAREQLAAGASLVDLRAVM